MGPSHPFFGLPPHTLEKKEAESELAQTLGPTEPTHPRPRGGYSTKSHRVTGAAFLPAGEWRKAAELLSYFPCFS